MSEASLAAIHTAKTKSKHLTHKQYRSELKTALDAFQKTREWADLIQSLSKLHKVFIKFKHIHDEFNSAVSSSPSVDAYRHRVLPHTVDTCKVLAMCLTPGRPAGVHLKAIEVYQAAFENLSRQNLVADLGLWLCGLLPLASFASTRVRPILLKLLREHIISLGEPCRVALDGLITSLLPCCEEQHTPIYFQAVELLNELAQNTGLPFFFSAIMRTICSCSHVRISATHYLNLLFKDKSQRKQCIELCKANETLTIQAFLCVLRDDQNILAKRNILDLLNSYFQLNQTLQNKLEPHQILLLLHGLLPVMLFREVSVNRRIYSWLLNIHSNDIDTTNTRDYDHDMSQSMSSINDDDITDQLSDDKTEEHVQMPLCLSEFSQNLLVDAFRLYLDRTGDIHNIALNCIAPLTAYPPPHSAPHNTHSPITSATSVTATSARSLVSRSRSFQSDTHHMQKEKTLPVPGLSIFKKLTCDHSDGDPLNAEQYITSPLNLLKILIDRNEIRSSQLIQRLHSKILQYAYSFEPNSMSDPTNLESITCFQAVIQATQLIYAQIDTHHTIQWLRTMIQTKYTQFVQITAPSIAAEADDIDNTETEEDKLLNEISPTKRELKKKRKRHLSVEIPLFTPSTSFIHSHWVNRSDSCSFTLMNAIELIDFALDFIPIVSHRDEILDSIAHLEQDTSQTPQRKFSSVDKDVACLVGDVLSKLHTLLIGDTRIQGIRFCLKLFQRLGKKASTIPAEDIIIYLTHSVATIPSLEMVQEVDTKAIDQHKYPLSPRTEMHNRLELEVIELNFQLLQIVIEAQDIKTFEDDELQNEAKEDDHNSMRRKIANVILQHLHFAEKCVYHCKSEQMVICGAQIWLKLINSFKFVPKHDGSCKKITQRLWELIEPSKSSAINYQIAKLLLTLADINYTAVQRVLSQNITHLQHTLQHNLTILAEGYQRFCTLYRIIGELKPLRYYWNEPVYIMLAACDDDRPLIHNISTQWLTESLAIPPRVLDPMVIELLETSTQTNPIGPEIYQYHQWYDPRLASDTLKKLLSIVISMGGRLISSCKNCSLTTNVVDKLLLHGCSLNADHLQSHLQAVLENNTTTNATPHARARSYSLSSNYSEQTKKKIELRVHRTSSLYLPEFQCRDYLDVLVLVGLKYIRGNVDPNSTADVKNSGLRVRTIAIEFLRRLFQQFGHNLRSAKLAAGITSTIVHQLSIAIQQKQYLLQIELLSLLSTLITVTYRRVNPKEAPPSNAKQTTSSERDTKSDSKSNQTENINNTDSSQMLFIAEPNVFSSAFFTNTIISGIAQSCKLRLEDMQIQLYPLKHFLRFCTFSCDYIKKGLSHFIGSLFAVLCEEIANNNNIQHMKHLLDGAAVLLRKLIRNPNESSMQVNEDTDFNAGTWMVHILTFGLATASARKSIKSSKEDGVSERKESMERPSFLVDAEMNLFRSWPAIMHSLCVAWGRTLRASHHFFGGDNYRRRSHSMDGGTNMSSFDGQRRNSLLDITEKHSISRRHRKELDEIHIRHVQEQIIDLVTPFFIRHNTLVFVAVLNNWEKELNTGKVWALEMQSTAQHVRSRRRTSSAQSQDHLDGSSPNNDDGSGSLIVNYGGHTVLSRECEAHKNVLNLLNRIMDEIPAPVVLHSICDIAMANIQKSEIRGTSMLVRMNQCTPLHFMYYYIHSCASPESIVSIWPSIRKYFDLISSHNSCHPMAYVWTLSILQRMIERIGSVLMNDKQRKKSFNAITKVICHKIADVAGHPEKYEANTNSSRLNHDPMCLPPILFYVPSREHHSNDFPPLNDWIQQLLISREVKPPPPLSTQSFRSVDAHENGSRTQENLSQKVYNSQIPRVYSSPTLGVSLASIRVLANMLSLFLHQVFVKDWQLTSLGVVVDETKDNTNNGNNKDNTNYDTDSINSILYGVICNLSNILTLNNHITCSEMDQMKHDILYRNLSFLNGYGSILSSLSVQQYRSHTFKTYIRDAWNYFLDDKFFVFADISTLHHWQWIIGAVIECDKSKLKYELLNSPTSTINVLFNKHQVEIENRTKQLKRLAFVIHAGRRDQYGRYLNTILEKLVEALKISNASILYCQVFVCLRVLLTRIDVTNLSPIWPLIITKTIEFFETSSDKELLLSVCKFVDTALILLPQTFQLFKWSFIQDSNTQKLLRRHSSSSTCATENQNNNGSADTVFIPHLQLLAKRLEQERKDEKKKDKENHEVCKSGMFGNGLNYNKSMKRPILLMRTIQDVYELIPFHRIVSSLHQQQSQTIHVEYKFLDDLIRSDFIQSSYFANPLLQDIREPSPF
eukprot:653113_1